MLERHKKALSALEQRSRLRVLKPANGIDFTSNDYLALSQSPSMRTTLIEALERGLAVGATGSRLLRGNHPEHELLEAEAAALFQAERALFWSTGYIANVALFSTLPQRGDLLVYDAFIHASCHDGMRTCHAECIATAHNDPQAVTDAISAWRAKGNTGRVWIAVESLYSMDGDRAPLADLVAIADAHEAFLIIDEAHATGVFGPDGRGLSAGYEGRENIICVHTCGKALGAMGALICAPAVLCDYLVNRARAFVYSTAPSPLMAVAVRHALVLLRREPERRERLHWLIDHTNQQLETVCGRRGSGSQIVPFIVGADGAALKLAAAMQCRGYDIRGIRPPTVPQGTARLRITVTLNVSEADVNAMLQALSEELEVNLE
jgi:8-amino-7-oxononanoate synthase